MSSAPSKPKILIAGLGKHAPTPAVPDILAKISSDLQKCADAGYLTNHIDVNPEDLPGTLDQVRQTLEKGYRADRDGGEGREGKGNSDEERKDFDGLLIGYGVRGMKQFTVLFEEVINVAVRTKPGVRLVFSTAPDGIFEAVERNFGGGAGW